MTTQTSAIALKQTLGFACSTLLLALTSTAFAQAPAAAPAGASGICKDGTYSTAESKSGACRGHKGVQTWYKADVSSLPAPSPGKTASAPTPTAKAATPSLPAPAASTSGARSLPAPTPATSTVARPAPAAAPTVPSRPAPAAASSVSTRPAPSPAVNTPSMPAPQPSQPAAKSSIAGESARLKAGAPAPGGGPGLVWVNTSSKVYHCPGSDFYGKTKAGSYMPEADARAQGDRPNRNKPCS